MNHIAEMLDTHPHQITQLDRTMLQECIEAAGDCAQTCTTCADACLCEDSIADLVACIRYNLDCADLCDITVRVLSRSTDDGPLVHAVLTACARACRTSAEECRAHADVHAHCRVCAEACEICADACEELLAGFR